MASTKSSNSIKDKTFIFTGTLTEFTRADAESLVKENGGSILSGVTDKLNYLVVGEDAGSKLEKAKKIKSIKVLKEKEFLKLVTFTKSNFAKKVQSEKRVSSSKKEAVEESFDEESTDIDKEFEKLYEEYKSVDIDGFKTTKVAKQNVWIVWMAENLNIDKFRNGDTIPQSNSSQEWQTAGENKQPAWCYYDFDASIGKKYGKLYNWYAVNDPRGLAPDGWHIPNDDEWTTLKDFLGGDDVAGKSMKSEFGWDEPEDWEKGKGTDESGLSCLPGGYIDANGAFSAIGEYGGWWSSTEDSTNSAWTCDLDYDLSGAYRYSVNKARGRSVRCIKD